MHKEKGEQKHLVMLCMNSLVHAAYFCFGLIGSRLGRKISR